MTPLAANPTIRIWREESTGRIMRADNNIAPDLKLEVVNVPDGQSISSIDEKIEGSYPFGANPVGPTPRN